jgi:thioredoxin-related protein
VEEAKAAAAAAAEEEAAKAYKWETDFEEASERAKAEKKPMLVDFTGSDWCGWCIKLKKEVFDTQEFKDYAAKNLVLVELDFPRRKEQGDEEKAQNKKLMEKYGIQGFPTILILSDKGREVARTGYKAGGPDAYIEHLKELLK